MPAESSRSAMDVRSSPAGSASLIMAGVRDRLDNLFHAGQTPGLAVFRGETEALGRGRYLVGVGTAGANELHIDARLAKSTRQREHSAQVGTVVPDRADRDGGLSGGGTSCQKCGHGFDLKSETG